MKMVLLKVNDRVMAKWPGSSLWFEGKIMDFNDIEYLVQFNDEGNSEYVLKHRDVKLFTAFHRSRSRSRGRSRSKSRGRGTRKAQLPYEYENEVEDMVQVVNQVEIVNAVPEPEPKKESPKPVSTSPVTEDVVGVRTSTPMRQSLRVAAMTVEKNEVDGQATQMNNVNATKKTTSVEEPPAQPGIGARICSGASFIGSSIKRGFFMLVPSFATVKVAVILLVLLALPLVLNRMCTKNKCTVMEIPDIPTKLHHYYDLRAVAIAAGFLVSLLLLSLIPLGRKVDLPNGSVLRCNGYIPMLVALALVPALMYFGVDVLVVYKLYQHLLATVTVLSVVLALLLYIKARNIPKDAKNPLGNTGLFLPDLSTGRELSPVILGLDVKFLIFRAMALMLLLFNVIVVIKDLDANKGQYSPTLLVACTFQIFVAVDTIWFEESISTMYEYNRVGCGLFTLISYLMAPFYLVIYSRVVLNHRTELEWYFLSLIAAVNLIGYTLSRGSYSQIHAFRKNPSDPAVAHLESLPTSAGRRLLVSGWWGVVRHPNYLGNIISFTSWTFLCGFNFALPWVILALTCSAYIQRIYEVERDCKRKYGTAWDSYTQRVKNRLIPKVF
ncbi:delta(14)-sterol reductase TM7SF2-like isoform X3 [Macrobrachium nipponense]|uniref:delta(14)-sterol reductase TM7SF2-like isoform X3 n=1 Tax=Macrobrachium nipponense TaxID=159736 RepID=UPI0030C7FFB6